MSEGNLARAQSNDSMDSNSPVSPGSSKKRAMDSTANPRPVKRRATKACSACRSRKVRCDVTQSYHKNEETGNSICSNCVMDGIECVVEESKRRKKIVAGNRPVPAQPTPSQNTTEAWQNEVPNPPVVRRWSGSGSSGEAGGEFTTFGTHVPHSIYQSVNQKMSEGGIPGLTGVRRKSFAQFDESLLYTTASLSGDRTRTRIESPPFTAIPPPKNKLPAYIKPLPQRMSTADIDYLFAKGALSLPEVSIRNALLQSYIEYVHPYMPLVELHKVLETIDKGTGEDGDLSLLLFQSIMFAATAFVDSSYLRAAGFSNRKAARKAFFQKARVLYDFDYEVDRVALVQSLLLMTYWYETPDDQKDTWHWTGLAISLAHTIGLHRNPDKSNMEPNQKKLWKRIWWSCFMRDRLVALGMRRPTRVKDEDYDVPMLTEDDFEISPLSESISIISPQCTVLRDVKAQRELAQMCIAKAKLCLCISHVLTAQYSVLIKAHGMQGREGNTRTSVMLFPKKIDQTDEVRRCDDELTTWIDELPASCHYNPDLTTTSRCVFVQRSLLHMIYFTTISALHRPQVLPSTNPGSPAQHLHNLSREKVRLASREITSIVTTLHENNLEIYLPTTGVTVLLPAIIIHLLDIKSANEEARATAMQGFCQCMQVLDKLRDNYASADFATQFLEAAVRKAHIDITIGTWGRSNERKIPGKPSEIDLANARARARAREFTPPLNAGDVNIPVLANVERFGDVNVITPPDSGTNTSLFEGDTNTLQGNAQDSNNHFFTGMGNSSNPNNNLNSSGLNNVLALNLGSINSNTGMEIGINMHAFNPLASNMEDVNMNEYLDFGQGNEWNLGLDEGGVGAHGESGSLMGDMGWIDNMPGGWSGFGSRAQSRVQSRMPSPEPSPRTDDKESTDAKEKEKDGEAIEA